MMASCVGLGCRVRGHHMPCLMLWMIWKMAERHRSHVLITDWTNCANIPSFDRFLDFTDSFLHDRRQFVM